MCATARHILLHSRQLQHYTESKPCLSPADNLSQPKTLWQWMEESARTRTHCSTRPVKAGRPLPADLLQPLQRRTRKRASKENFPGALDPPVLVPGLLVGTTVPAGAQN